jgi:hypothetical protein
MSGTAKARLRAARERLAAKDYREAVAECRAALEADPSCADACVYIGKASFLLGDRAQVCIDSMRLFACLFVCLVGGWVR